MSLSHVSTGPLALVNVLPQATISEHDVVMIDFFAPWFADMMGDSLSVYDLYTCCRGR